MWGIYAGTYVIHKKINISLSGFSFFDKRLIYKLKCKTSLHITYEIVKIWEWVLETIY